jgi:hypothetical protein
MTRIFTDGAEMGDTLFFDTAVGAVSSATKRSGAYSYQSAHGQQNVKTLPTALSEFYVRYAIWSDSNNETQPRWSFSWKSSDGTVLGGVAITHATASIDAYVASSKVLSAPLTAFKWSTWQLFEVHVEISDTGHIDIRVDGNSVLAYSGDTLVSAYTTATYVLFGGMWTANQFYDDLALNDTAGGVDDSWCGDGQIVKLTPDEDGAHNNWHGSDTDDIDNYLLVDDFPKDNDTTYVYHDASGTGVQDEYRLADVDFTGKTILRVYPEVRALKTSADAATLKLGILPNGSTDQMSAGKNLGVTYGRVVGDEYKVNPADAGAWEDADLDALSLVLEVG